MCIRDRLNPIRFELKQQYRATVMKNGHVRLGEDAHYYSVPCGYIGKKVILLYTSREVCKMCIRDRGKQGAY